MFAFLYCILIVHNLNARRILPCPTLKWIKYVYRFDLNSYASPLIAFMDHCILICSINTVWQHRRQTNKFWFIEFEFVQLFNFIDVSNSKIFCICPTELYLHNIPINTIEMNCWNFFDSTWLKNIENVE